VQLLQLDGSRLELTIRTGDRVIDVEDGDQERVAGVRDSDTVAVRQLAEQGRGSMTLEELARGAGWSIDEARRMDDHAREAVGKPLMECTQADLQLLAKDADAHANRAEIDEADAAIKHSVIP
jgi:hypothetical protein